MSQLTAGTYNATCHLPRVAEMIFTTSANGSDGIVLDFTTEDGGAISTTLWLTPRAYDRTLKVLEEVFKFDGDFNALARGEGFPNYECKIVVEMEEYQHKTTGETKYSPRVKWINSRGPKREPADVRGVLSRLARQTGKPEPAYRPAPQPSSARQVPRAATPTASQMAEDDIPFMRPHHLTVGSW